MTACIRENLTVCLSFVKPIIDKRRKINPYLGPVNPRADARLEWRNSTDTSTEVLPDSSLHGFWQS